MQITTIGLGLAKNAFQVHGVDSEGRVVVRRKFRRAKVREFFARLAPCLIGMEASAQPIWARELIAMGHQVKIMPPSYVKAYGAPRRRVSLVEETADVNDPGKDVRERYGTGQSGLMRKEREDGKFPM